MKRFCSDPATTFAQLPFCLLIAERITALGGTVHVEALSTALADFGKKVRKNIDDTDELGDKSMADLFTEISREIDKLLWFVEAHIQA